VRLSRFVLTYRDAIPGEHVLYDVLADRYVGVDARALEAISRWRDASPAEAERESAEALAALGFLVADDAADDARLGEARGRLRAGVPGMLHVSILPTLACNLACTYCVQKTVPTTARMGADVEDGTVAFVLRRAAEARSTAVCVHYIGGEALTRKDFLLRTAARISEGARELGASFSWELTTNGIGLDPEFARQMLSFGRGAVKVTLDGDRETHDQHRVYRDGRGSFDAIYRALVSVARECPDLELRLGGNFQAGEEASYERLLERISADGLNDRLEWVRFKPVVDAERGCASCHDAGAEADGLVQLGRSVERRGLGRRTGFDVDAVNACEMHWDDGFTVDPEGRLYRCFGVAGRPEMAVGTVWRGVDRPNPLVAGRPWETDPQCRACAFAPVCMGGCLAGEYLATGRVPSGHGICQQQQYEKTFREAVVRRYLAEFHCESLESSPSRAA
jgi:uncharacterized protein